MNIHFKTRDLGPLNDYPAIGWMPPLPSGSERLWQQYGNWSIEEYPQLVLAGNGASWQLYLEGMDSGRTDSATGMGGRVIRMSLYLTGTSAEASLVYPLLDHYVNDILLNKNQEIFRKAFASAIKPGDPFKWRKADSAVQAESASKVWEELKSAWPAVQQMTYASESDLGFAAGLSPSNVARFLRVCSSILSGKTSGTAIALANARLNDLASLSTRNLVSMLSLYQRDDKEERRIGVGGFAKTDADRASSVTPEWGNPPRTPEPPERPWCPDEKRKRVATFSVVALTVLVGLLMLSINSCRNSKTTPATHGQVTQAPTNTCQGVQHGN